MSPGRYRTGVSSVVVMIAMGLLGACAMNVAPDPLTTPSPLANDDRLELERLEASLAPETEAFETKLRLFDGAPTASRDPAKLCDHRASICRIAGRICDIARRHPTHVGAQQSCERATRKCEDARRRTARVCSGTP